MIIYKYSVLCTILEYTLFTVTTTVNQLPATKSQKITHSLQTHNNILESDDEQGFERDQDCDLFEVPGSRGLLPLKVSIYR